MLLVKRLLGTLLVAVLGGCATMEISHDYDPAASFSDLKSYDWMPGPQQKTGDPRIDDNSLLATRVRDAVETQLAAKGFTKGTVSSADFLVGYHATLNEATNVMVLNNYYGYGPGWGWSYHNRHRPYGWSGAPETYVYTYDQGTLILDVVAPDTRKLIWRGSATDEVSLSASGEAKEKKITQAVAKILENFPPK